MLFKEYLELNGISYAEAAKALGVTRGAICSYALMQVEPQLRTAMRIAEWSKGQIKIEDLVIKR